MDDYAFVSNVIALVIYNTFLFWQVLNTIDPLLICSQLVLYLLYHQILVYEVSSHSTYIIANG